MISIRYQCGLLCVGLLFSSRVASQQPVRIDDTNVYSLANPNGIQFSSEGWSTVNPGSANLHYDGTYTWSQAAGSNLVFFFRGTTIAHYADMGPNRGPVGVSIDGYPYDNATWTAVDNVQYQQQMWNITGLSQGDHQVVISNVGTGNPATSIMGVDYLEITPGADGKIIPTSAGPGASGIPSNAVLVDDSSEMISYSGSSWEIYASRSFLNSNNHSGFYFGGTQHSSRSPGGVITFPFNGTAVWYFSDQYENNTMVGVSLDGGAPDMINTASTTGIWLTQILVWSRTGLADGPHTLTITHAGIEGTYANVDFFKYMPSVRYPPTISASPSPPATSSASAVIIKSTPIGAIVGGVVGGVALIALIVGILIWRWRRQPTGDTTAPQHETYVGDAAYDRKESYVQSPPGAPGFASTMNYQAGMYSPTQTQNAEGQHSITPTTWTGATYAGHPEIH
ncbi:hypothetical protein BDV93DRAFT_554403 [Ceratobasidium sp. AG-I]|nr:hypothetical protein BDV93DRAFT_554403 [Ceratobasidium sp. AG-I]